MPDATALNMDVLTRPAPAISASGGEPISAVETTETAGIDLTKAPLDKTGEPPQSATTEDAPADDAGGAKAGEATGADKKPGEDNTPPDVKRALTKLRNEARAATARAEQAEADRAKLLELVPKPKAVSAEPRPTIDQFTTPEAYDEAVIAWATKQGEEKGKAEALEANRRSAVQAQAKALVDSYQERKAAFEAEHDDFAEVAEADDLPISIPMAQALMLAENGPQVAYHLGQNKDEAARIAKLDPAAATFEIGKLAAKLSSPQATPRPRKHNPITPVGAGGADIVKSPDEMSMDEYAAANAARLRYGAKPN